PAGGRLGTLAGGRGGESPKIVPNWAEAGIAAEPANMVAEATTVRPAPASRFSAKNIEESRSNRCLAGDGVRLTRRMRRRKGDPPMGINYAAERRVPHDGTTEPRNALSVGFEPSIVPPTKQAVPDRGHPGNSGAAGAQRTKRED